MHSAVAADRFDSVRAHIRKNLIGHSIPSVAVAVAKDGRIIWEEGFGWADREQRIPATQHTMYSLASISKPITATALMALAQAGKVDLDKPANDYLDNVKLRVHVGDALEVTVRRIANHTSGLPTYHQFFYADEPYIRPSMDETISRYGNVLHAPGQEIEYSNLGYGVLGHVIERVSGMSYAEYMRREVFAPLGLTRTSVDIGPGMQAYAATRYDTAGAPLPFFESDHPGAADVFASAHDLVRFGMFHMKTHLPDQKPILSDASIDEMQRQTSSTHSARVGDYGFGVGFMVSRKNGYRLVSHAGNMSGARTQLYLIPDEAIAIVVLSNAEWGEHPFDVADHIAAALLPNWPAAKPASQPARPPVAFTTPVQLAGSWQGILATYQGDIPFELRFTPAGDVHAKLGEQLIALVNEPHFDPKRQRFEGRFVARIGTPDTERFAYVVDISLDLHGDALAGSAHTPYWQTGFPAETRRRSSLAHWVRLERQALLSKQP